MNLSLLNRIPLPAVALVVVTTGALCVASFIITRKTLRGNLGDQVTAVCVTSIAQVNTVVTQMDKVTQSNAATAEEIAAAAEELNSQSLVMHGTIADLQKLSTGKKIAGWASKKGLSPTTNQPSEVRAPALRRPLLATQSITGA